MDVNRDITIVAQGSGFMSAYHVGVIKALAEVDFFKRVKKITVQSGSTLYIYAITGQIDELVRGFKEFAVSGNFISLKSFLNRKGLFNLDYFVDHTLKQQHPIDLEAYRSSPIEFEIALTDADTGKVKTYTNKDGVDPYELIRASAAYPIGYINPVKINGSKYYDGSLSVGCGLDLLTSKDKNILMILTLPNKRLRVSGVVKKFFGRLILKKYPKVIKEAVWNAPIRWNQTLSQIEQLKGKYQISTIQPENSLPARRAEIRTKCILATIDQGYEDGIRFLKKNKTPGRIVSSKRVSIPRGNV